MTYVQICRIRRSTPPASAMIRPMGPNDSRSQGILESPDDRASHASRNAPGFPCSSLPRSLESPMLPAPAMLPAPGLPHAPGSRCHALPMLPAWLPASRLPRDPVQPFDQSESRNGFSASATVRQCQRKARPMRSPMLPAPGSRVIRSQSPRHLRSAWTPPARGDAQRKKPGTRGPRLPGRFIVRLDQSRNMLPNAATIPTSTAPPMLPVVSAIHAQRIIQGIMRESPLLRPGSIQSRKAGPMRRAPSRPASPIFARRKGSARLPMRRARRYVMQASSCASPPVQRCPEAVF